VPLDMAAVADADWDLAFDGLETVSVVRRSAAGETESTDAAVTALPRALSWAPAGVGGTAQMVPNEVRWHLRASTVSRPRRGDRVVSTSDVYAGTYVITSVAAETFGTRYRCETQRVPA
jgi:cystathionine beta-lyase/cystathionine gamma-synthase